MAYPSGFLLLLPKPPKGLMCLLDDMLQGALLIPGENYEFVAKDVADALGLNAVATGNYHKPLDESEKKLLPKQGVKTDWLPLFSGRTPSERDISFLPP